VLRLRRSYDDLVRVLMLKETQELLLKYSPEHRWQVGYQEGDPPCLA
jgi:hypothetical protein